MEYNYLPDTNIKVSKICLGTMTWGRQNTQEEAFEQMNFSLENGVNFFDTALYKVKSESLFKERQIQNIIKESRANMVTYKNSLFIN